MTSSSFPSGQAHRKNWQKIRQNPQMLEKFLVREKVVDGIRAFFKSHGFHEVETPLLVQHPGTEPFLDVFETKLLSANGQSQPAFLLTSPEYAMKKLLVAGMGPIFQICKSFRNGEGISSRHNPEFSILEWYRPHADYTAIMDDCEHLLASLCNMATGGTVLNYQGRSYDLKTGWERISVAEAFEKYVGVDLETMLSEPKLKAVAAQAGFQVSSETTWEEVFHQFLLNKIEPNLGQKAPTILYDYPASQAALSRRKTSDPRLAERFEFFCGWSGAWQRVFRAD
jgi:lysyl-tRNA synthetase class 2